MVCAFPSPKFWVTDRLCVLIVVYFTLHKNYRFLYYYNKNYNILAL